MTVWFFSLIQLVSTKDNLVHTNNKIEEKKNIINLCKKLAYIECFAQINEKQTKFILRMVKMYKAYIAVDIEKSLLFSSFWN